MIRIPIVILFLFSIKAFANDDIHVISKNKVLDDVSSCSIESFKTPLVYASSSSSQRVPYYENLRSKASTRARILGRLPIGSLVRVNSANKAQPGQKAYMSVRVAQSSAPRSSFSRIITGTSIGFLWGQSVEMPDQWIFKIIKSRLSGESGDDATYLNDKYLRVVKSGSSYSGVRCCLGGACKNYALFSVSPTTNTNQVENYIAFQAGEMGFIQQMQGVKIKTKVRSKSLKLGAQGSGSLSSAASQPATAVTVRAPAPAPEKPVKVYNTSTAKVVCTKSARLNVRDESLKRVIFKAKKYEEITPYKSWSGDKKKRGHHTYVQVKFTQRNKVGWVSEKYVKVGSQCPGFKGVTLATTHGSSQGSGTAVNSNSNSTPAPVLGQEMVICSSSSRVNVRNDKLQTAFRLSRGTKVNSVTSVSTKRGKVGGRTYDFKKISAVVNSKKQTGWVAVKLLKEGSSCSRATADNSSPSKMGAMSPVTNKDSAYVFPLNKKPTVPYVGRVATSFGWRRSGGKRKHAACDLKRPSGDTIRAIHPGTVLRSYSFYGGTNALEVKNDNGEVIRYGEVSRKSLVKSGQRVEKGQVIAKVGRLNSGNSMLHFELFSGKLKGKLTSGGNKYKRRADLLNPSERLQHWQKRTLK